MGFHEFQEEEEATKTEWEAQQKGNDNGEEQNEVEDVNKGEGTADAADRWERQDNEMEDAGEVREDVARMGEEEEEEERVPETEDNGEVMGGDTNAAAAEAAEAAAAAAEEEDEEVRQLVEAGNMEQLANLVLNGEGHRLMGQKSDDPELQGFLNNVPAYMASFPKLLYLL